VVAGNQCKPSPAVVLLVAEVLRPGVAPLAASTAAAVAAAVPVEVWALVAAPAMVESRAVSE
jgi:hypothetical protein